MIHTIPIEPRDAFQDQVDLVKSSGAQYDGTTRTWSHHLTAAHLAAASSIRCSAQLVSTAPISRWAQLRDCSY